MEPSLPPDSPLTVMQLLPALDGGGVERGTVEVNNALVARGHRSIVVSAGGRQVEAIRQTGGEHICLDLGRKHPATLLQTRKLRQLLGERQVDIVHARSRMPAWITWLAWRELSGSKRPRFLTTVHGLNSVNRYSRIMTRGERVIAVSNYCRDYVLRNYPTTDQNKMVVIFRGVDRRQFPYGYQAESQWIRAWKHQYPQLEGRFVVLLPGRMTRLKGHHDFLAAIATVKSRGLPVHAVLVGGEDPRRRQYARSVHEQVGALKLTDDVTLTGFRSDIREIMSMADAVVSTSTKPESFGRTVLESIRMGRPTLGYDHGGVGEILEPNLSTGARSARRHRLPGRQAGTDPRWPLAAARTDRSLRSTDRARPRSGAVRRTGGYRYASSAQT